MKRRITRPARTTWTRTAASLLASCLLVAGTAQADPLPPPTLPPLPATPLLPGSFEAGAPVGLALTDSPARSDKATTAVFIGNDAGAIQQTGQVITRPRDREETVDFSVTTELPGPDRMFRRESETDFLERIRQEGKGKAGTNRIVFPENPPLTKEPFRRREFPHLVQSVEPSYVCHGRLLFEQPNFERAGWNLGVLTPLVCVGKYYYDVVLLPYHCFTRPFEHTDCSAGKILPGDPTPLYLYHETFSVTGLVGEAAVLTGLFYLFP